VGGDDAGADPRVVDVAAFGDQDTLMFTVEVTGAAAGLRPGALVRGHEEVPGFGQLKSPLVATEVPGFGHEKSPPLTAAST
jgi:hypothetical protein